MTLGYSRNDLVLEFERSRVKTLGKTSFFTLIIIIII